MPVYFFTFHAYGSWMPDRKRGYVRREEGVLPPDPEMAEHYRRNAKEPPVSFNDRIQQTMIDEVLIAARFQQFQPHGIGSDPSHLHSLVSWRDERNWDKLRNSIKSSLSRRLNIEFEKRSWFVESASRKRVETRDHYDHLIATYIPDHVGWKWSPEKGLYL